MSENDSMLRFEQINDDRVDVYDDDVYVGTMRRARCGFFKLHSATFVPWSCKMLMAAAKKLSALNC